MRHLALIALFALVLAPLSARAAEREPVASLDVKDADVHDVLKSLKEQCGIRNLLVDKDVSGSATFYFHDVPCTTAFDIVARTYGLQFIIEPNSVVNVRRDSR